MPVLAANGRLVLFIHVPKSAGSSVEGLLSSYGRVFGVHDAEPRELVCNVQHFHAPLLEQVYASPVGAGAPGDLATVFDYVFMTVREPLARLASEFYYRLRFRPDVRTSRWTVRRSEVSMDDWVHETLDRVVDEPYLFDNHIRPQHEFSAFGAVPFRVEDGLDPVRRALDVAVGTTGVLPSRLKTSSRQQRAVRAVPMSPETVARVVEFYAADYARFGYQPPVAGRS